MRTLSPARAQQPGKLKTIGYMGSTTPSAQSPWTTLFFGDYANLAGSRAVTSRLSIAGPKGAMTVSQKSRLRLKVDVIVRPAFIAVATTPRGIVKIAKPTVEISDKVRLNLEKFVWSSREK